MRRKVEDLEGSIQNIERELQKDLLSFFYPQTNMAIKFFSKALVLLKWLFHILRVKLMQKLKLKPRKGMLLG
jgi:hypothetical protein